MVETSCFSEHKFPLPPEKQGTFPSLFCVLYCDYIVTNGEWRSSDTYVEAWALKMYHISAIFLFTDECQHLGQHWKPQGEDGRDFGHLRASIIYWSRDLLLHPSQSCSLALVWVRNLRAFAVLPVPAARIAFPRPLAPAMLWWSVLTGNWKSCSFAVCLVTETSWQFHFPSPWSPSLVFWK